MASDNELSGRVAIVTGAGRNIGRGIALALAQGGAAVVVNARSNLKEAEGVAGEIERAGGKAFAVTADVADAAAVDKMVAEQLLEQMTLADWRAVTSIILDGAFNCVKACLPYLKRSGVGVIVNIGGLSAHTGAARRPHVVTAKAGLIGFTRALAHELAEDKIRVNTVTPGLMSAPRPAGQPVPQHHSLVHALAGRRGEPADIAAAVRFLCGPGASFITGQNIQVNGGTFLG
jgi:3-oxoacyl-[acyl-carrier protein] reductase